MAFETLMGLEDQRVEGLALESRWVVELHWMLELLLALDPFLMLTRLLFVYRPELWIRKSGLEGSSESGNLLNINVM